MFRGGAAAGKMEPSDVFNNGTTIVEQPIWRAKPMLEPEVRELYCAADTQEAYFLKNLLADAGIESRITEDSLLNAVGDLPASAIAPRIWVRAKDFEKARTVVVGYEARREVVTTKASWKCPRCGEPNEASFDICWNCQMNRDDVDETSK